MASPTAQPPYICATGTRSTMPTGGFARTVRGLLLGSTVSALALAGHVIAGGSGISTPLALLVVLAASAISIQISARRWRLSRLIALAGGTQIALHALFMAGATGEAHVSTHPPAMLAAHLLATAATVVLLGHADAVWWLVADVIARRLAHFAAPRAQVTPPRGEPAATSYRPRGCGLRLARAHALRAPPLAV